MKWKKLLLLGDSNTQFGFSKEGSWVSLLSDYLQRKCDVINRGFSGYNTEHIHKILPEILNEFEPENTCGLILMLGSNDSADQKTSSIQHVPLKRYIENLEAIISYITQTWGLNKNKLIIITPPKIDNTKWSEVKERQNCVSSHFDELVIHYANECADLAIKNNLELIDLYKEMAKSRNFSDLLFDGLHLSTAGGLFLFELLKPVLEKNILEGLKYNFPYWKDINLDDIKQF